jgi:DNA (cytosine-5)-methyltransferase 1
LTPSNPHAWLLADLDRVPQNGLKVMSTFACGGGSSMGYKRAGYQVIAANDIDPEMAWHYKRNIRPKHYFLCPIRDLLTADLPAELFDLDILDGSPPCSTFSMAGSREDAWGKDKHFREGQAKQVLSDLFFDFLDVAERLKPRVILAENVKGMLAGNAKGYCKLIFKRLRDIGYRPQLFLLNAADCGVPQRRERVFFCAVREDVARPEPLTLAPSHHWISFDEATKDLRFGEAIRWEMSTAGNCRHILAGRLKTWPTTSPSATLTATENQFDLITSDRTVRRVFTYAERKRLGSFPDDYQAKSDRIGKYMIGMSVPPKMTEYVAREVAKQWFGHVYQ